MIKQGPIQEREKKLQSSIGNLYERIIKARLEEEWSDVDGQSGFKAGRSYIDYKFCPRQLKTTC